MNKFFRFFFALVIYGAFLGHDKLVAQLNNSAFGENLGMLSGQEKKLFFKLRNLNFFKNNEYFNPITSGQTLFGTFMLPSLVYFPKENVRLELGGFFWKDFGDDSFTRIAPVFRLSYQKDSTLITFGNLPGNLNHRLIEPLYDFDNLISRHLESGFQLKHHTKRFYVDLWVDWQNRIFRFDDEQEVIFGGLVSSYKLVYTPKFELILPFQATIKHQGGQDLTVSYPVTNAMNIATGLNSLWKFSESNFLRSFRMEHTYLSFSESATDSLPNGRQGLAYYGTLNVEMKWFELMLNWWLGHEFDSSQGGELYRSYSIKPETPGLLEVNRRLLFLRFLKDFRLMPDLSLSLRLEPYYDFESQLFEYSFGIYMHYQPKFLLKKFD